MTSSFGNNSPPNGLVSAMDPGDFFQHELRASDYAYANHQYMPAYQRYHQPYSTPRFDVPCNLTPPQHDRTSPYDLTCLGGTPRYGHIANSAMAHMAQYQYDVGHCNQGYYQTPTGQYYRPDSALDAGADFENSKLHSPSFTPPMSATQYENIPSSNIVPSTPESSTSGSGVPLRAPRGVARPTLATRPSNLKKSFTLTST